MFQTFANSLIELLSSDSLLVALNQISYRYFGLVAQFLGLIRNLGNFLLTLIFFALIIIGVKLLRPLRLQIRV